MAVWIGSSERIKQTTFRHIIQAVVIVLGITGIADPIFILVCLLGIRFQRTVISCGKTKIVGRPKTRSIANAIAIAVWMQRVGPRLLLLFTVHIAQAVIVFVGMANITNTVLICV